MNQTLYLVYMKKYRIFVIGKAYVRSMEKWKSFQMTSSARNLEISEKSVNHVIYIGIGAIILKEKDTVPHTKTGK